MKSYLMGAYRILSDKCLTIKSKIVYYNRRSKTHYLIIVFIIILWKYGINKRKMLLFIFRIIRIVKQRPLATLSQLIKHSNFI